MSRAMLEFPAPPFTPSTSDADLLWLPSPEALAGDCVTAARTAPDGPLLQLLKTLGAPPRELLTSPLSARVSLLAAEEGRFFVHHELRGDIPLTEDQLPEVSVWADEDPAPRWVDGVRTTPKYFSGQLEAPLATYDPNHRIKWRTHELLHRLVGFFWRPDLTRFEAYLGARLSELLPVVHWYGLDEIVRARCVKHQSRPVALEELTREHCRACDAAVTPYWQITIDDAVREGARTLARAALQHLTEEFQVIHQELEAGRSIASPRGRVDGSSDAQGYLRGHWNRITSWSFGAWVELFLISGTDHATTVPDHAEHLASVARRLLTGTIEIDAAVAGRARLRREIQDVGQRALQLLEHDEAGEEDVLPAIDAAAALAGRLASDGDEPVGLETHRATWNDLATDLAARLAVRESALPEGALTRFRADGYLAAEGRPASAAVGVDVVAAGLKSAFPETGDALPEDLPRTFLEGPAFVGPGELRLRVTAHLGAATPELVRLEAFLRAYPRADETADLYGAVPPPEGGRLRGRVRPHRTLRRGRFRGDAVAELLGFEEAGPHPIALAVVWQEGQPRAVVEDAAISAMLDEADASTGLETMPSQLLTDLCDGGFLVWFPSSHR